MLLTLRRLGPKSESEKTARIIHSAQRTFIRFAWFPTLANPVYQHKLHHLHRRRARNTTQMKLGAKYHAHKGRGKTSTTRREMSEITTDFSAGAALLPPSKRSAIRAAMLLCHREEVNYLSDVLRFPCGGWNEPTQGGRRNAAFKEGGGETTATQQRRSGRHHLHKKDREKQHQPKEGRNQAAPPNIRDWEGRHRQPKRGGRQRTTTHK